MINLTSFAHKAHFSKLHFHNQTTSINNDKKRVSHNSVFGIYSDLCNNIPIIIHLINKKYKNHVFRVSNKDYCSELLSYGLMNCDYL